MDSNVVCDTIYGNEVFLLSTENDNNLLRCVSLACSLDYHLTRELEEINTSNKTEVLSVAYRMDKVIIIYNPDSTIEPDYVRITVHNWDLGSGCVLIHYKDGIYKLVSVYNSDNEHVTCFSKYHPLVNILVDNKS
jgi:hypothetical protein